MSKVSLTSKMIDEQPSIKALLELEPLKNNWVDTYNRMNSKKDGEMRYEAEKILFLQTLSGSKQLQSCDKFSIYSSFTELSISGLTLRDGISYIVPFGKKATFMVGWRGRLEQINEIPTVIHCHEPQVVYDCDKFEYSLGMKTQIQSHVPDFHSPRTKDSKITKVYFVIEFKHGSDVYIMDAIDVLKIRDGYSSSYKQYVKECAAHDKKIGETFEKNMGNWMLTIEPPMWVNDEAQAFKKTIVKRVYGTLPKLAKQKWLDEKIQTFEAVMDPDEKDTFHAPKEPTPEELNQLMLQAPEKSENKKEAEQPAQNAEVINSEIKKDPPAEQKKPEVVTNTVKIGGTKEEDIDLGDPNESF